MAVIDLATQQVEPYPQIVKDQNLQSLAYDVKDKLVWGGTNRWGQMKSAPPTSSAARMAGRCWRRGPGASR
jgi:hypothetical protein